MTTNLEFGFYPEPFDEMVGSLQFSTLSGLDEAVDSVRSDEHVEKDWVYAPARRTRDFLTGAITASPYSARVFGLPKTHCVQSPAGGDKERLEFLAQCFGFFVGMRMSVTEAGFLDATPIGAHVLTDFTITAPDLSLALAVVDDFWLSNQSTPDVASALLAAIHALFLAQQPQLLNFEEFIYLYTALEACHAVSALRRKELPHKTPHGKRIDGLCSELGISTPLWAIPQTGQVWTQRNKTLHEGFFVGEPLGFRVLIQSGPHDPSLQQMRKLLCRIIVGLLGISSSYRKTSIDARQVHRLCVSP